MPSAGPSPTWPPTGDALDLEAGYDTLLERGIDYGPAFRCLTAAWRTEDGFAVELTVPEALSGGSGLHPAVADSLFHVLAMADGSGGVRLPFAFNGVRRAPAGSGTLHGRITLAGDTMAIAVHDTTGAEVHAIDEVHVRTIDPAALGGSTTAPLHHVVAEPWTGGTTEPGRWVVVGPRVTAPAHVARVDDLTAVPADAAFAVVGYGGAPEDPATSPATWARQETARAAADLRTWLGAPRTSTTLVVLTHAGDSPAPALAAAAVGGLVRAAQAENPGRLVAVTSPSGTLPDPAALRAAVEAGESELIEVAGTVHCPRLRRTTPATGDMTEPDATDVTDAPPGPVVITGGTGALGGLVAEHLARTGRSRDLVLVSRRGPDAPGVEILVETLTGLGARVRVRAADLSDRDAAVALLAEVTADAPLRGFVHSAGVLDDSMIDGVDDARLARVFAPKVDAAWHVHDLTRQDPPALFVLFSSLAGVIGNPGQGAYAAANAGLDALACHRHGLGLPATSIAWGSWATAGMAATLDEASAARLRRAGIEPLATGEGLAMLDAALASGLPTTVATRWHAPALQQHSAGGTLPASLRGLVRATTQRGAAREDPGLGDQLGGRLDGLTREEGVRLVVDVIRGQVAGVLGHAGPEAVEVDQTFSEAGFDSLASVELRNRLDAATGLQLPATVVFDHPTVTALAHYVHEVLAPPPPSPEEVLRESLAQLDALIGDDHAARARLVLVAQSALSRWAVPAPETTDDPTGVPVHMDTATDEELFALIDS